MKEQTKQDYEKDLREKAHGYVVIDGKIVYFSNMLIYIIIAELIFWSPCIITGLLALIVSPWWWTAFGAIIAFWAGPFTPAMPLQFALALGLKKLHEKIKGRQNVKDKDENDEQHPMRDN